MNKKLLLTIGTLVALAAGATTSYYSPLWTMREIYQAAKNKEADRLPDYIDFGALRENLKSVVMAEMSKVFEKSDGADNPFMKLGMALATTLINPMIDSMVSPAGLVTLIGKGKPLSPLDKREAQNVAGEPEVKLDFNYSSWDRVYLFRAGDPGGAQFIMRREGVWSWKLVSLKIPNLSGEKAPK